APDGAERRRLGLGRRHGLGEFENVGLGLRRWRRLGRGLVEVGQHRIDVVLAHGSWFGRRRLRRWWRGVWRRQPRLWRRGRGGRKLRLRLGGVVVSDDASDGGENLLHRRLLRLRGLVHGRILVTAARAAFTPPRITPATISRV